MVKVYRSERGAQRIRDSYDRLVGAWGIPVEERNIAGRYGTTHVLCAGDEANPALLLFHGVGDNSALMWRCNAAALSRRFRLYAVDMIGGSGKSVPGPAYYDKLDHGLYSGELMDSLGLDSTFTAGTSFGCWPAAMAAIAHPDRVKKTICMAGGIVSDPKDMLVFLPEALFPTQGNIRRLLKKLAAQPQIFLDDPLMMEHWGLLLRHFNNRSMAYHLMHPYTGEELDSLRDRTLFLIGNRDPIGYSSRKEQALRDAGMNYKIFPDVGHGINHEISERINQEIINFMLGE